MFNFSIFSKSVDTYYVSFFDFVNQFIICSKYDLFKLKKVFLKVYVYFLPRVALYSVYNKRLPKKMSKKKKTYDETSKYSIYNLKLRK